MLLARNNNYASHCHYGNLPSPPNTFSHNAYTAVFCDRLGRMGRSDGGGMRHDAADASRAPGSQGPGPAPAAGGKPGWKAPSRGTPAPRLRVGDRIFCVNFVLAGARPCCLTFPRHFGHDAQSSPAYTKARGPAPQILRNLPRLTGRGADCSPKECLTFPSRFRHDAQSSNSAEKRSMHAEELHGETAETTDTATKPSI